MGRVNIKVQADSQDAQKSIDDLTASVGSLNTQALETQRSIQRAGDATDQFSNQAKATSGFLNQLGTLAGDIGNLFKVALFDLPVGITQETLRILGNQRPPPFLDNLQEQIQATQTATEEAIRPLASLGTVLGNLENEFANISGTTEFYQVRLQTLQPELDRVNARLATKRAEYVALVRDGTDPADTSLRQVTASIENLEGKSKDLTREVGGLQKNIVAAEVATREIQSSTETFGGALSSIDTRFLSYQERVAAYTGEIRGLPPAITAVREGFDVLAPTAERVTAIFDNLNTSLVNSQVESELLDAVTQKIIQDLQDLEGLAHVRVVIAERTDAHNANLVSQAVSEAVESFRDYNDVLSETGINFERVDSISDRLTSSIREQASAFDELARSAGRAATAQQGTPRNLQNQLPGQVIGSGVFDDFNAQTPSFTQGRGYYDPRITGGDNTLRNNLLALGNNLETFTEDFTVNVGDIVSAVEGGISPLDAFERSLTQLDPALAVFTTTVRLLIEEIGEAERRREEFRRTRDITETQRGTSGRGRLTGLGSDTVFPGSSGRFQTQIGSVLSLVQGTGEEAVISGLLNQISEAGADRSLEANLEALETAYQPFIDGLQRGMEAAGNSLRHAIGQGFDESVISRRVADLTENTTRFYDTQVREVRAAATLTRNDPRNAVFALVRERDALINQATNQLRSFAPAGPQNAAQFRSQTGFVGPTEGLDAPTDDQERGIVFDPERAEIDATSLQNLNLSNLQTQADDAIRIFNEAINSPLRTIQSINEAFTALEPQLQTLYDTLFEGIAGPDGIINTAEEEIAFNQLGTFEQFTERYAGLRDTAIEAVNASRQRLDTLSQQIATDNVISTFRDSILAPSQTVEGLIEAWDTNVVPSINSLYDQLFANIAGPDGFINTTDETAAFLQLGSREDFTGNFRTNLLEPGIEKLQSIASTIAGITQDQELTTTFDGFNAAILAPGQTIEGLTSYWQENVVPTLRETYDFLREQVIGEDGLISPDENLQLIQMGLNVPFEDWAARHEDNILTPGISRLASAAEIIASIKQSREQDAIIKMFNAAASAPGATITGINMFWIDNVVPELRDTYNFLREQIIGADGIISPEELARLTQAGLDLPFTNWVETFNEGILIPATTAITAAAEAATAEAAKGTAAARTASDSAAATAKRNAEAAQASIDRATETVARITQNREVETAIDSFNAALLATGQTIAGITQFWINTVVPELRETYDLLREQIIGADGIISPEELARLTQQGLDIPFEDWEGNYRSDILEPGISSLRQATNIITGITQDRRLDDLFMGFSHALMAPGATVLGVTQYWIDTVDPALMEVYEFERGLIIGEDGLISPQELAQLTQAGLDLPVTDWALQYKDQIFTPGITKLSEIYTQIGVITQQGTLEDVLGMFNTSAMAPGATVEGLGTFWQDNVDPVLRDTYDTLRAEIIGADGLISPSELLQLTQAGLNIPFVDWASAFETDIRDPAIANLDEAAAHLTSTELSTSVDTLIETFRESAAAPGATISALREAWNTNVVPALSALYGNLFSEITGDDGIINTALEQADLLRLGTEDEFITGFTGDIFDPAISAINSRATSNARSGDRFNIRQARFNLGDATSEQEFIDLFGILGTAINTFYDNEEARIEALGLGVEETTRLLAENDQSRREEFRGLSNITNTFAQERLRTEEETQADIDDLRDDAVEAEERRLQREADLHQRHADRLMDIETRRLQAQADSRRDHFRNQEDIIIATARRLFDEAITSSSDLTAEQFRQVTGDTRFIEDISDLRRDERREDVDLDITTERATEAADTQLSEGILSANEMAVERLTEIHSTLGGIAESLSLGDTFENIQERITMGLTPFIEGITEIFQPFQQTVTALESLTPQEIQVLPAPIPPALIPPASDAPPNQLTTAAAASGAPIPVVIVGGTQPGAESGNVTVIVQLDDGTLSQVEGRLATRADQGLSPLKV